MIDIETINESTLAISRELDCLNTLAQAFRMAGTYRVADQIEYTIREINHQLNKIDEAFEIESMTDRFSVANR